MVETGVEWLAGKADAQRLEGKRKQNVIGKLCKEGL